MGLCLNASKAETRLDTATLLLGWIFVWGRIGLGLHPGPPGARPRREMFWVFPGHLSSRVLAPNRLQTTYVPAKVLYLVEQLPHCDLLKLILLTERFVLSARQVFGQLGWWLFPQARLLWLSLRFFLLFFFFLFLWFMGGHPGSQTVSKTCSKVPRLPLIRSNQVNNKNRKKIIFFGK